MKTDVKEKLNKYISFLIEQDYYQNNQDNNSFAVERVVGGKNSTVANLIENGIIGVAWHIGGMEGGSCYSEQIDSNGAQPYTVDEQEPKELKLLDKVFDSLLPDLTFKQYKLIMNNLKVQQHTVSIPEYYGNRTDYMVKYIKSNDLLNAFEKENIKFDENILNFNSSEKSTKLKL